MTEIQPTSLVLSTRIYNADIFPCREIGPCRPKTALKGSCKAPLTDLCVPWCCSFLLESCLQHLCKPGPWAQSAAEQSVALASASNKHFKVREQGPTSPASPQQAVCCTEHFPGIPACGTDLLSLSLRREWLKLCTGVSHGIKWKKMSLRRAVLNPALLESCSFAYLLLPT